jgi:hypothetical protein
MSNLRLCRVEVKFFAAYLVQINAMKRRLLRLGSRKKARGISGAGSAASAARQGACTDGVVPALMPLSLAEAGKTRQGDAYEALSRNYRVVLPGRLLAWPPASKGSEQNMRFMAPVAGQFGEADSQAKAL